MRIKNKSGMQENEFEKQLKEMMEEFQLSPSDSVWEKISRSIKKDKRRKMPFIFLLLTVLITAGYFIYHVSENRNQNVNSFASSKNDSPAVPGNISLKDSDKLNIQTPLDKKDTSRLATNDKTNTLKNDIKIYDTENNSIKISKNKYAYHKSIPVSNNSLLQSNDNNNTDEQQTNLPSIKQNNITALSDQSFYKDSAIAEQKTSVRDTAISMAENDIADNISPNADSIIIKENRANVAVKNSTKKSAANNYKSPNWQFGISALYGRSNIVEGLITAEKSLTQSLSNPGPVAFYDTIFHNKHPYTSSNAYGFGVLIQKKITKHGFITLGINYMHLSVKSDIGRTIDSAITVSSFNGSANYFINRYAQPGPIKKYTSNYNFVELPVYFQQDFLHTKNTSFSLNAGMSLLRLISSNALLYNQYNNVYFSKNDLLRKTQFQFMAGLNFKFNTGKNSSLYIGPQLNYSLSNLIKNNNSNLHFVNYGIQAGILLHKK
ncbi:MAG: hypothetical protein ABI405_05815 [Parafilimonas sp.]